jgi:hypothetical protein
MRIINKPNHQKRKGGGEYEEQNGRTRIQKAKIIN